MQFLLFLVAIGVVVYGVMHSGLAWVIVGTVAVGILSSGRFGTATADDAKRFNGFVKSALGPPWRQFLLASLLCSAGAAWIFDRDRYAMSSTYLWLAALALILAAGFVHDWMRAPVTSPATGPDANAASDAQGKWTWVDWGIAAALALLALGLRLYQIGVYLPPVHGDEGEMGMLALRALHGMSADVASERLPLFSTAFLDHPTLFHFVQAFGLWLFGESMTSLREVSAIFGALCASFVYAIGRVGWGRVAGLTAGWLLAVSHLHIQYSRIALNNIETVLFVIVLIWLLARVYESSRRESNDLETNEADTPPMDIETQEPRIQPEPTLAIFIVMGLVIGLGQYLYYGSRLMPVLAVVLLFALWRQRRVTILQATMLVTAALVAYLPLGFYYANDLSAFFDRMKGVSVLNPIGMAHTLGIEAIWPNDIPLLLWTQIKLNLYFFLHYGDRSGFYLADIPAFDQVTVALFWLGLGVVLAKVRRYHELALVAWFGIGVLLAGVLTTNAPYGPRLVIAVPAMYVIGGVFVQNGYRFLVKVWPTVGRWLGVVALSAIAASTLYLNFNTYFVEYKSEQPNLTQVNIAQEMGDKGAQYRAYLLGAPNLYVNYGTIRFLAVNTEKYDLETRQQFEQMLAEQPVGKGALLIALPQHFDDLDEIAMYFPNGTKTEHPDERGIVTYITYQISPEALAAETTMQRSK